MELHLLVGALRRRWALIAVLAVMLALCSQLATRLTPEVYTATSTLLLDPTSITVPGQEAFAGDPERYIEGQLRILGSPVLAATVADAVAGADPEDVREAVQLDHVIGSDVVEISATADDPQRAAALANGLSDAYVGLRASAAQSAVADEVARTEEELEEVQGELVNAPADAPATRLLLSRFDQLLDQRAALTSPGVVRDRTAVLVGATEPTAPSRSSPVLVGLGAALMGGAVGITLALLLEARDPRIATSAHAEAVLGRRPVARLLGPVGGRRGRAARARSSKDAASTVSTLIEGNESGGMSIVAVSELTSDVHASAFARSLAEALSARDLRVALASRDGLFLRSTADDLNVPARVGVATTAPVSGGRGRAVEELMRPVADVFSRESGAVWAAEDTPATVSVEPGPRTLHGDGSTIPDAASGPGLVMLDARLPRTVGAARALEDYVSQLQGRFDVVVLDLPPLLEHSLTVRASAWCRELVLMIPIPSTRTRELDAAAELLDGRVRQLRPVVTKG